MAMNVDDAVKRFLAWPLPDSVRPDGTYPAGDYRKRVGHRLVGTNLLTADEARQMFENCLSPAPVTEGAQREAVALILSCLHCGEQHIDRDEWATRPHKTHLCEHCGGKWRPANFATVGVSELPPPPPDRVQPERYTPREVLLNLVAAVTAFTANNGPTQCNLLSQAMRDARRALWVQPELVEEKP